MICQDRPRVRFVHLPGHDFFNTLRDKLAWGLDVRSKPTSGALAE